MNFIVTLLVALGIFLLLGAVIMLYFSRPLAVAAAWAGLLVVQLSLQIVDLASLVFWGVAAIIVLVLERVLPGNVTRSRRGVPFIVTGCVAGALVGLVSSHSLMVIGAVVGAILGAVAFSGTRQGREIRFPTSKFLNYLCAKAMPAIITVCIAGTALNIFLIYQSIQ